MSPNGDPPLNITTIGPFFGGSESARGKHSKCVGVQFRVRAVAQEMPGTEIREGGEFFEPRRIWRREPSVSPPPLVTFDQGSSPDLSPTTSPLLSPSPPLNVLMPAIAELQRAVSQRSILWGLAAIVVGMVYGTQVRTGDTLSVLRADPPRHAAPRREVWTPRAYDPSVNGISRSGQVDFG